MKRISDCYVSPAGKQHILTADLDNREDLNESLIMDHDQDSIDYDFVTKVILAEKRSVKNENLLTSHIILSRENTSQSLSEFLEEYGNFPLPDWMSAAIIRDISKALLQLHTNQVLHGAVTAKNIRFLSDEPKFGLLTSRATARKIDPFKLIESRAEDISQLGHVLFRCLCGHEDGSVDINSLPFKISEPGVFLASKMMARKFSESAHYIIAHPFIAENTKIATARFLKLN